MTNTIPDATLVLKRNHESLWLSNNPGPAGHRFFIALSKDDFTDYPVRYSDGRLGWDFPERFSEGFRKMVRLEMNAERNQQYVKL